MINIAEKQFSTIDLQPNDVRFLAAGTLVDGRYKIIRVLGSGGMGNVYQAIDTQFAGGGVRCAIKQTLTLAHTPPTIEEQARIRALIEEHNIMSKLDHAFIPKIWNFFEWNNQHYLVMDYIEGVTLNDLLTRQKEQNGQGFDEEKVINWALRICEYYEYLHGQNPPVIYRDCKPDNLILSPEGQLILIDFGIARHLVFEAMRMTGIGTHGYAAPETYLGNSDQRSDIFSLGALMFALLTTIDPGQVSRFEWDKHTPKSYCSTLTENIDRIISKCLKHDVAARWQSARQLHDELEAHRHNLIRMSRSHLSGELKMRDPIPGTSRVFGPGLVDLLPHTQPGPHLTQGLVDILETPARAPEIVWEFPVKGAVRSSPVARDGSIYFGCDDKHLYAFDLETGKQQGAFSASGRIFGDPIVTNSSVIFGADDGCVYAVDRSLKRKIWSYHTGKPIVSSPTVINDLVVIGNDAGLVFALPLTGGEPKWNFPTFGHICGSLATIGRMVIFGSHDQRIYALDGKGVRQWWYNTRGKVDAAPVALRDMVIVGGLDRSVYAFDLESGAPVWRRQLDHEVLTSAAISDRCVYVGSAGGHMTCLDSRNGEVKWRYNVRNQITTDLVVQQGRVYFGCADGGVYCLDLREKRVLWRHQARSAVVTRPALWNDLVIVGSFDRSVYALRDAPRATEESDG